MRPMKVMWGDPKPGCEAAYWLAWKHRAAYMDLYRATPRWQWRKRSRRLAAWGRAVDRIKINGQHRLMGPVRRAA